MVASSISAACFLPRVHLFCTQPRVTTCALTNLKRTRWFISFQPWQYDACSLRSTLLHVLANLNEFLAIKVAGLPSPGVCLTDGVIVLRVYPLESIFIGLLFIAFLHRFANFY